VVGEIVTASEGGARRIVPHVHSNYNIYGPYSRLPCSHMSPLDQPEATLARGSFCPTGSAG
jgi:hypothetical protein